MVKIRGAHYSVSQDIVEKIGSLSIINIQQVLDDLEDIELDSRLIKIAWDIDALHILRFEIDGTRHCVIENFRFWEVVIR